MNLIDIASWQAGLDLEKLFRLNPTLDGVIVKLTQGGTANPGGVAVYVISIFLLAPFLTSKTALVKRYQIIDTALTLLLLHGMAQSTYFKLLSVLQIAITGILT